MSRSTASPPLERGVLSKRHRRASEATKGATRRPPAARVGKFCWARRRRPSTEGVGVLLDQWELSAWALSGLAPVFDRAHIDYVSHRCFGRSVDKQTVFR